MSENGTEEKLTRSEWAKRKIDLIQLNALSVQCTLDCSDIIEEIEDLNLAAAEAEAAEVEAEAEAAAEVEVDPDNGNRKRDLDVSS
jgi:hypothetical protein